MKLPFEHIAEPPQTSSVYQHKSDIYSAAFAREHAFNKAFAYFLYAMMPLIVVYFIGLKTMYLEIWDALYIIFFAAIVGMVAYGRFLSLYTDECREIMWENEVRTGVDLDGDGKIGNPETQSLKTIINGIGKNERLMFDGFSLSPSQIKAIASTAIKTKTLTVNWLESIGLTRTQAESFRIQCVHKNLAEMDDSGRIKINENGIDVFTNNV